MDLKTWRATREVSQTLPSGLTVRARKAELLDLVTQGAIPTPLLGMVDEMTGQGGQTVPVTELSKYVELIDVVVQAIIVDPPLAAVADEEHLSIKEVPFTDRLFLFNQASGGAASLVPFSAQPATGADAAPAGEHVSPAA